MSREEEERKARRALLSAKVDRLDSAILTAAALRWLVASAGKVEPREANECGQIIAQKFADLEASRMAARKALQNFELSPVESIRRALTALGIDPLEHVKEHVKGKENGPQQRQDLPEREAVAERQETPGRNPRRR